MNMILTGLIAGVFFAGSSVGVLAETPRKMHKAHGSIGKSAGERVGGYGSRRAFDETQYYERLSERIPFGTQAWWRQKQAENPAP